MTVTEQLISDWAARKASSVTFPTLEGWAGYSELQFPNDPERKLVVSDYLRLEVFPKPTFHKRQEEIEFMQTILGNSSENISTSPELTERAVDLASKYDMTPIDALHASAAVTAAVDELVTMEKDTKPLCRVKEIKVVSLYSTSEGLQ